jgi:hypothetical protein
MSDYFLNNYHDIVVHSLLFVAWYRNRKRIKVLEKRWVEEFLNKESEA